MSKGKINESEYASNINNQRLSEAPVKNSRGNIP